MNLERNIELLKVAAFSRIEFSFNVLHRFSKKVPFCMLSTRGIFLQMFPNNVQQTLASYIGFLRDPLSNYRRGIDNLLQ
jgi:hypothetical protein